MGARGVRRVTVGYRGRGRLPALLVCLVLAVEFVLACVPFIAERGWHGADAALTSGPLYGGAYFYGPIAPLIIGLLVAFALTERRTGLSGSGELLQALASGPLRWPAALLLLGTVLSAAYGCTAYWYATPDEIVAHPGWPSQSRTYGRGDMRERVISCRHYKGRTALVFDVVMRDGTTISLGNGTPGRLEGRLAEIAALTGGVGQTLVGSVEDCPGTLKAFAEALRSAAGLAPRPAGAGRS